MICKINFFFYIELYIFLDPHLVYFTKLILTHNPSNVASIVENEARTKSRVNDVVTDISYFSSAEKTGIVRL